MNIETKVLRVKMAMADFMRLAETEIHENPRKALHLIMGFAAFAVFFDWVALFEYFYSM